MPQTNDTSATSAGTNGHSRIGETLYALTDEQILDIDDAEVTPPSRADAQQRDSSTRPPLADFPRSDNSQGAGSVGQTFRSVPGDVEHAPDNAPSAAANRTDVDVRPTASGAEASEKGPQETAALEAAPPEWLAQAMNDPQRGGEARQFWESAQQARAQAAQLASLDHAYFGARDAAPAERSASRDALAQQLLREVPTSHQARVTNHNPRTTKHASRITPPSSAPRTTISNARCVPRFHASSNARCPRATTNPRAQRASGCREWCIPKSKPLCVRTARSANRLPSFCAPVRSTGKRAHRSCG